MLCEMWSVYINLYPIWVLNKIYSCFFLLALCKKYFTDFFLQKTYKFVGAEENNWFAHSNFISAKLWRIFKINNKTISVLFIFVYRLISVHTEIYHPILIFKMLLNKTVTTHLYILSTLLFQNTDSSLLNQ